MRLATVFLRVRRLEGATGKLEHIARVEHGLLIGEVAISEGGGLAFFEFLNCGEGIVELVLGGCGVAAEEFQEVGGTGGGGDPAANEVADGGVDFGGDVGEVVRLLLPEASLILKLR